MQNVTAFRFGRSCFGIAVIASGVLQLVTGAFVRLVTTADASLAVRDPAHMIQVRRDHGVSTADGKWRATAQRRVIARCIVVVPTECSVRVAAIDVAAVRGYASRRCRLSSCRSSWPPDVRCVRERPCSSRSSHCATSCRCWNAPGRAASGSPHGTAFCGFGYRESGRNGDPLL